MRTRGQKRLVCGGHDEARVSQSCRFNGSLIMRTKTLVSTLYILILSAVLSGCGYTFYGSTSVLPPDVKRIYIPMVENNSTQGGLSVVLTESLQDQFERYGVVSVAASLSEADAILRARIVKVTTDTRSVISKSDTELQQDVTLLLSVDLRRVTGQVLWRDPNLVVSKSYGTTQDSIVTSSVGFTSGSISASDLNSLGNREISRGQERQALNALAVDAAQKVYEAAVMPDF